MDVLEKRALILNDAVELLQKHGATRADAMFTCAAISAECLAQKNNGNLKKAQQEIKSFWHKYFNTTLLECCKYVSEK